MNAVARPKGWQESSLGKIATIERKTVQPEKIQAGTVYLGLEHITSEGQFTQIEAVEAGELASNKFVFSDRHVLYGKLRPYLKKIARPSFTGICSTDILPILPSQAIDRNFLFYYLRQPKFIELATARSTGANLPRLSPKDLAEFPVVFPAIAEQRRIAEILDRADAVRRKRQAAIVLTEELLRSIFLEMFGDPVVNPKGWHMKSLEEITRQITDGVHFRPVYIDSGIPFISVKDITTGKLLFDNCKYISKENHEQFSKRCKPEQGDILYTKVGATYGRPALVDTSTEFSIYVSVCLIKPIKEIVRSQFLKEVMATPAVKHQADRSIKGIGVPDLHLNMIKKFLIPVPDLAMQDEFLKKTDKIQKYLLLKESHLNKLNELFNSLLQRAFRGEL